MNDKTELPPEFLIAGIPATEPGLVDRLLSELAERLEQRHMILAGAVQSDIERKDRCRCDMTLRVLGTDSCHPISMDLGPFSQGCRLDTGALENAAWEVESTLRTAPETALPALLIVNKFGKSEAQAKGFCNSIGLAMERGIPVLCGVGRLSLEGFHHFTAHEATLLEPDRQAIERWVDSVLPPTPLHTEQAVSNTPCKPVHTTTTSTPLPNQPALST